MPLLVQGTDGSSGFRRSSRVTSLTPDGEVVVTKHGGAAPVAADPADHARLRVFTARVSYPEPRYLGETGQSSATLRRRGDPPDLVMPHVAVHYLATGPTTAGDFGLYRWDMNEARSGPSPHFHRTISESFFVLAGTVGLYDGRGWTDAAAGDFLHVPAGGIHAFRNESGAAASMLILFTPGAPREQYFEALAERAASGRTLADEELAELLRRHDQYDAPSGP